jgi:selenide, water dikinase
VTGAIDPAHVLRNGGAKPGDVLFLTKPLGTGIVGTAIKFDRADPGLIDIAVQSMCTLNRAAAEAIRELPTGSIHACTDITGFGLAGHATEMAVTSGVTLTIDAGRLPLFAEVLDIVQASRSGGLKSNQTHFADGIHVEPGVDSDQQALFYDPQTSGGLLIASSVDVAGDVAERLRSVGAYATPVGSVRAEMRGVHVVLRR